MTRSDRYVALDVRRGNREAFAELVRTYQARVYGLVLMIVRRPADAEEITQDAFVRAFTQFDRYEVERPFYPWLACIAVRLAQNRLVSRRRTSQREGAPLDAVAEPAAGASALTNLLSGERARTLWQSVAMLPTGQRTAVMLYYRDGLGIADIARALGVTSGTVKTLLFRARSRLRADLGAILHGRKEVSP